jgi:predicted RNA methylase
MRMTKTVIRSPLRHLDVETVSEAARREARRRERHLPPVSVFRWWARRTEAVVGGVLDVVQIDEPGPLVVADPFAGGGTIALAAAMRGHTVYAQDINPWAVRGLATSLSLPTAERVEEAAIALKDRLSDLLAEAYEVGDVTVLRTMRVKVGICPGCSARLTLYPTGLVSMERRIDAGGSTGWIACPAGHLVHDSIEKGRRCPECNRIANPRARFTSGGEARCYSCKKSWSIHEIADTTWTPCLVEVLENGVRTVRPASPQEVAIADSRKWRPRRQLGPIPEGAETRALRRQGFESWEDLYPRRQRVVMERVLEAIPDVAGSDLRLAKALETVVVGVAEFAGYASRWDPRYLKPYETIANHRFQATTLAVEPNVWGVDNLGRGTVAARLKALSRAAAWADDNLSGRSTAVRRTTRRVVLGADTTLVSGSSHRLGVPDGSLDLVLTDPPYHDDVQYAELAWLYQAWNGGVHRLCGDLTVGPNGTADGCYRTEMTRVFLEIRRALKKDGHLILSYANRDPRAWVALVGALHDAGFQAAGAVAVMAENDADHSKLNRRAATYDLLIDVVRCTPFELEQYKPSISEQTDQGVFLGVVTGWVLQIGSLENGWEERMVTDLQNTSFLR